MPDDHPPMLDPAHADLIVGPVGISAAACRPGGFPALARAAGCRVAADRRSVTVLFGATIAADVLDGVRRSGAIAVVFSEPPTHRTLQLKGTDALVLPPEPGDAALAVRYREAFGRVLASLGFLEALGRAIVSCPLDDLVTVRFTPSSAFLQTPGPRAGEAIAGRP
jgi:hypothetical protein